MGLVFTADQFRGRLPAGVLGGVQVTFGLFESCLQKRNLLEGGRVRLGFFQFGAAHRQLDLGALEFGISRRGRGRVARCSTFQVGESLFCGLELPLQNH